MSSAPQWGLWSRHCCTFWWSNSCT